MYTPELRHIILFGHVLSLGTEELCFFLRSNENKAQHSERQNKSNTLRHLSH